jgi:hypothetical protein
LNMKRLAKLSITAVLTLSLTLSPLFANKASAQWVVYDPANFAVNTITATANLGTQVKEGGMTGGFGLDALAWFIVNIVLERMSASVVNWINSGFKGSPTFVTDPESYFKGIANDVAGEYIYRNPQFRYMCSPFKAQVQVALQRAYSNPPYNFQCTLGDVANNWENFMEDFSAGGWDGFISLTQNTQNTPIGLYQSWQGEMEKGTQKQIGQKQSELNQGRGFLSIPQCSGGRVTSSESDKQYIDSGYKVGDCPGGETVTTPGAVVESQLNSTLGVAKGRLQVADEINEIISALLNQLVNKALGGLSKLARSASGNDKSNYLDQLNNATDSELKKGSGITTIPLKVPPTINNYTLTPAEACPRGLCICPSQPIQYKLSGPPDESPGEWWCRATECPDGYSKDAINEQCISSNSIQTTITTGKNEIQGARGVGEGIINCTDTTCFGAARGGRDREGLPPGATTTASTTPTERRQPASNSFYSGCGDAALHYRVDDTGFIGSLCGVYAQLTSVEPSFPEPGGSATWVCTGPVNNVYQQTYCNASRAAE